MTKILTTFCTALILAVSFLGHVSANEIQANYPQLKLTHYNVQQGLSQSTVTSMIEDQYGYLWVGTLNGLNRFDGKTFKHYFADNDKSLPNSFIRSLYLKKDGTLLIGTDKGLAIYDHEMDRFSTFNENTLLANSPIWSISQFNEQIHIATDNKLITLNNDLSKIENVLKLNTNGIKKIIPTQDEVLIRTYEGKILKTKSNSISTIVDDSESILEYENAILFTKNKSLINIDTKEDIVTNVTSITNNNNYIYIYNDRKVYKKSADQLYVIGELPKEISNIPTPELYIGKENIYLYAQNHGFMAINKRKNVLKTYNTTSNVWSITKYNEELVVASDSEKIKIYDKSLNRLKTYNTEIKGPKSVIYDGNSVYIATTKGLFSIDINTSERKELIKEQLFIVKKINNKLITGSLDGHILILDLNNKSIEKIAIDYGNPIFDIEQANNEIWVASQGGLFNIANDVVTHVFKDDLVTDLNYNSEYIYFGTRTSLLKISSITKEISRVISTKKPIYAITNYKNNIITSSNSEVMLIDSNNKQTTLSTSYGSQAEYNTQAIEVLDNNIYIGGVSGITKLQIDDVKLTLENQQEPNVYLDDLLIFNTPQKISSNVLRKSINFTQKLILKYSDYPFTLKFVTPGNIDDNLTYSYQMEGLSDTWINSKGINSATYTNLSSGKYTFKVYAIDPLTNVRGPIKSIEIEITPPWWLSLQAKLIYFSISLLLMVLIFKSVLKRQEIQRQIATSEERLKLSLWGSGDEMWDWDIETGHIYRSNIWGSLEFPRDGQRSGNTNEESNIHPMDQARVNEALKEHFQGKTDHFESAYRVKGKNNQWIWILDRAKIVERDENDKALRMTGTIKDINNFKQAEEQLRLFERAIENISEGMFILDNKFHYVEVNNACCDLCAVTRNDFIGKILKFKLYPESYSQQIRTILQQQGSWSDEVEAAKGDGSSFLMELTIDAIYDELGTLSHYVGVFSDISRRKRQEEELRKLTNNDLLTGLPNRSSLMVTLGNLVKKDIHHTLMVLDLDNFKKINDSLGHQIGDELLIQAAQRMEATVPSHTTIYRLGGDEFAILIDNNPDIGSSAFIANNVIDAFAQPFELSKDRVVIGVSIGIVLYPEDDQHEQALLRKADIAMYHAKSAGGHRYQFYSESLNKNAIRQLEVENLIREGLRDDQFEVHYQPKIDLRTGKMAGMEALVRLNHPEQGLIPPYQFIPLAEENGLIVEIGEVVLRKACFAAQKWRSQGLFNGRVAVNLSSQQFALPDLEQRIASILRLTQLPATNLELEITEGTVIKHPEKAIKVMMQLSKMGISLALDDFGTGYSSLSYLKRFPIDTLKIDKSFVDDIDKSDRDLKMVDSIITIAHNMGLSVVGEGVEDASQLSILKALKCEEIQGYIYSKPVNELAFLQLLKQDFIPPAALKKAK